MKIAFLIMIFSSICSANTLPPTVDDFGGIDEQKNINIG